LAGFAWHHIASPVLVGTAWDQPIFPCLQHANQDLVRGLVDPGPYASAPACHTILPAAIAPFAEGRPSSFPNFPYPHGGMVGNDLEAGAEPISALLVNVARVVIWHERA
jgi:hypothetical protein